jgi:hypothetical protein
VTKLPDSKAYWTKVRKVAKELNSDGCSGPTIKGLYTLACLEHDVAYRQHRTVLDAPITRAEADMIFWRRHQQWSPFRWFTPMGLWRYAALRLFAGRSWENADTGNPL